MNKAKIGRWHFASWPHESYMTERSDGEWVSYADYAALEKNNQSIFSENITLKSAIEDHSISYHNCSVCGEADPCSDDDVCMVLNSIPATLHALNEIKARTIEAAADYLSGQNNIGSHSHDAMYAYAASLRGGE